MAERLGFAQVERNHMSGGEVEGRIHAQLPVDQTVMGTVIENGRFAKYDYANGKVTTAGDLEWEMIYNEEKLYDERKQNHKDFALQADNFIDGEIVPRLMAVEIGDIWTTNAIHDSVMGATEISAIRDNSKATWTVPTEGTKLYLDADGYLATAVNAAGPVMQVVKAYTLADGQPAVKVMRIK